MLLGVPVFAVIYLLISDAVNLALKRKGRTTVTTSYGSIQAVEDLDKAATDVAAENSGSASANAAEAPEAHADTTTANKT